MLSVLEAGENSVGVVRTLNHFPFFLPLKCAFDDVRVFLERHSNFSRLAQQNQLFS